MLQGGFGQSGPFGVNANCNVLNVYAFGSHIPNPKSVSYWFPESGDSFAFKYISNPSILALQSGGTLQPVFQRVLDSWLTADVSS